jgi:hypothetical protein
MGPGLHGAVGEAPRLIGHYEVLVVAEDIAESLALGAGPEWVVEREEEGLRPGEGSLAARTAVLATHRYHLAAEHVHLGAALALGERRLERLGDPPPGLAAEGHAVEDDEDALTGRRGGEIGGPPRRVGQLVDLAAELDAGESAPEEGRVDRARVGSGGGGEGEADEGARVGVVPHQRLGHALGGVAPRLLAAARAVDAPDAAEEETQVVVQLGGGARRRARGPDGVLLLEGNGRPHALDPVHVGTVHPLEEHARVGRE